MTAGAFRIAEEGGETWKSLSVNRNKVASSATGLRPVPKVITHAAPQDTHVEIPIRPCALRSVTNTLRRKEEVGTVLAEVQLRSVSKAWGLDPAVDDVSFVVRPGQLAALLGPSGCGGMQTRQHATCRGFYWRPRCRRRSVLCA